MCVFFSSESLFWDFFGIYICFFFGGIFLSISGRFDTSGSIIPRLVPEISPCDCFCEEQQQQQQQELGILGVGVGIWAKALI